MPQRRSLIEELEARKMLSADLAGSFTGKIPGALSLKSSTRLTVKLTDTGAASISGPATLTLYASQDSTLDSGDAQLATLKIKLNLKPGKSASFIETFNAPTAVSSGSYFLAGNVVRAGSSGSAFLSIAKVSITPPFVDLTGSVSVSPKTTSYAVGGKSQKPLALTVNVTNHGNVASKGPVAISLYGSSNTTLDALDTLLTTLPAKPLALNPGKSKKFTINFKPTAATQSGKFYGIAVVNSGTTLKTATVESSLDNDNAVTSTTFTITNAAKPQKAAFVGGLSDDLSGVAVGTPELATFSARVAQASPTATVELDEVDSSGNLVGSITNLQDDGSPADGDAVAGDGIFAAQVPISFDAPGTRYFIAKVSDAATQSTGQTAAIPLAGINPPTDDQLQQDAVSSNLAAQPALAIAAAHGTAAQIIAATQTALQSDADVAPGSVSTSPTSIMWKNLDGTTELVSTDELLGDRGASQTVQTLGTAAQVASAPSARVAADASRKLAPQSSPIIRPADNTADGQTAVVLDPYFNQFGADDSEGDEAADIAQKLSNAGYGTTYLATQQITSLTTYQNLGPNAAVAIISHGAADSRYGTYLGTNVLDSEDPTSHHKSDLVNGVLVLEPAGYNATLQRSEQSYYASSKFFTKYTGDMDGTIVYIGACYQGDLGDMPNAFLGQGAGAVITYTGSVHGDFAVPHGLATFDTLLKTTKNTVGDIPGINVDTVIGRVTPQSRAIHPASRTLSPDGLVLMGVVNRFLSFGDLEATLPGKPKLVDVNLVVTYSWPFDQRDLDSRTAFAGGADGFNLPGGTYLNWLGDNQGAGVQETTIVDLYDAWKAGVFTTSTTVGAGADWYAPDNGKGPATVSVALEDIHSRKQYQIQSLIFIPGTETEGTTSQQGEIDVTLGGDKTNPTVTIKLIHS